MKKKAINLLKAVLALVLCLQLACPGPLLAGNEEDAWDQLRSLLENTAADQVKPLEGAIGKMGMSPSQLLDGMRAIDAIVAGDWKNAGENSAGFVIGLFSSTFGGYLAIHKGAREAGTAIIENWVQDLYDHPAYKGVVKVLNQTILGSAKIKNPYLPSYLCGGYPAFKKAMQARETMMYQSWVERPEYDVKELVTGKWAARIRQETGRGGMSERQIFNALLVKAVQDQKSFILTTFQRVATKEGALEARKVLNQKAAAILAEVKKTRQDTNPAEKAEQPTIAIHKTDPQKEPANDQDMVTAAGDIIDQEESPPPQVISEGIEQQLEDREGNSEIKNAEYSLPPFEIKGYLNRVGEAPLSGYASNGDIVAFAAKIEHPDFGGTPHATELIWQLYDEDGKAVAGVQKREKALESGITRDYSFRFRIDALPPGKYTVGLTHYLLDNPETKRQATSRLNLFDAASIEKIVVTDSPGGKEHQNFLTNDKLPHVYMYYSLANDIPTALATISVTDAKSGDAILSMTRERPAEKQYFGIRLEQGSFKPVQNLKVAVELQTPDGKTKSRETTFAVGYYQVRLVIPRLLKSGNSAQFRIEAPEQFEAPLSIDLSPANGLVLSHGKNALRGSVTGVTGDYNLSSFLRVTVTDSVGRVAKGVASVTVKAKPKEYVPSSSPSSQSVTFSGCGNEQRSVNSATLFTPAIVKLSPLACNAVEWESAGGSTGDNYLEKYQVKKGTNVKHGQFLDYAIDDYGTKRLMGESWYLNGKLNGPKYEYTMYSGKMVMNNVAQYKNERLHGNYWIFTSSGELNKKGSCVNGKCR